MKKYILSETNWKSVKDTDFELAVLPWGATEAHNFHLPYSTDNIETERIVAEASGKASEKGARLIVLPGIPFGVNTGQLDIKLTINMNPGTQFSVLKDISECINRSGIKKFLIVNGHGGNDFKQIIRELGVLYPSMFFGMCNWYQAVDPADYFEKGGGHADEMETSLMLYLAPEMILPLKEAGKGNSRKFRVGALNEKWAWTERKWTMVTSDTGIGDPSAANPVKGEKFFNAVVNKLSELMYDLSVTGISDMYV